MGTVLEWSQWYHLQEWILDRYAVLLITLLPYMWVCRVWLFRFDHHKISTRRSFTYLNFKDFFLWPLKDWKKPVVDLRQSRTYQLPSFNSSGFHSKSSSSTSPAPAEPTILATPPGLIKKGLGTSSKKISWCYLFANDDSTVISAFQKGDIV